MDCGIKNVGLVAHTDDYQKLPSPVGGSQLAFHAAQASLTGGWASCAVGDESRVPRVRETRLGQRVRSCGEMIESKGPVSFRPGRRGGMLENFPSPAAMDHLRRHSAGLLTSVVSCGGKVRFPRPPRPREHLYLHQGQLRARSCSPPSHHHPQNHQEDQSQQSRRYRARWWMSLLQ